MENLWYFDAMRCTLVHMCPRQFPRLISISSPDINYVNSTRKVKFECIWIFCPRICCICILLQFVQSLEFLLAKLARWWLFYFELRTCRQFPNFKHSRWVVTKACIQTTPKRLQNGREFWFKFKIGSAAFEKKKSAQRWLLLLLPTCCCVATSFPSASVRHMSEPPLSGLTMSELLLCCVFSHISMPHWQGSTVIECVNAFNLKEAGDRYKANNNNKYIQNHMDSSDQPFKTTPIIHFKQFMLARLKTTLRIWHIIAGLTVIVDIWLSGRATTPD